MARAPIVLITGGEGKERKEGQASCAHVSTLLDRLGMEHEVLEMGPDLPVELAHARPAMAFPCLHGVLGASAGVHAMLDLMGIAHPAPTGSAITLASSLTMSRNVLRYHNLPVVPSLHRASRAIPKAHELPFRFPLLVRTEGDPLDGGEVVPTLGRLSQALLSRAGTRGVVLEPHDPRAPVVSMVVWNQTVAAMATVTPDGLEEPDLSPIALRSTREVALRAGQVLGISKAPVLVTLAGDDPHIVSVNPLPSLAAGSMFMRLMASAGWDPVDVVRNMVSRIRRSTTVSVENPSPEPA